MKIPRSRVSDCEAILKIQTLHHSVRSGVLKGSLEDAFEVAVVEEQASEELVTCHFNSVVSVTDTVNLILGQAFDAETWVQESVSVDVVEGLDATVTHDDVTSTLVDSEPVTSVLKVNVVTVGSVPTGWSCTTSGGWLVTLATKLTFQGNATGDQVDRAGVGVPVSRSVVESFGEKVTLVDEYS